MIPLRARAFVAGVSLAALFAALLSAFPLRDFQARTALALRAGGPADRPADPAYRAFLDEVASATPRDSTVALAVPRGELYVYEAAYRLAPRRVIFRTDDPSASAIAVYGSAGIQPPELRRGDAEALLPVLSVQVLVYAAACAFSAFSVRWHVDSRSRASPSRSSRRRRS